MRWGATDGPLKPYAPSVLPLTPHDKKNGDGEAAVEELGNLVRFKTGNRCGSNGARVQIPPAALVTM